MKAIDSSIVGHDIEKYELATFADMINRKDDYETRGIEVPHIFVLWGAENLCKAHLCNEAKKLFNDLTVVTVYTVSQNQYNTKDDFNKFISSLVPYGIYLIAFTVDDCDNELTSCSYIDDVECYAVKARPLKVYEKVKYAELLLKRNFPTLNSDMVSAYAGLLANNDEFQSIDLIIAVAKIIHVRDLKPENECILQSYLEWDGRYPFSEKLIDKVDDRAAIHEASHALLMKYYNKSIALVTIMCSYTLGGCIIEPAFEIADKLTSAYHKIDISLAGKVGEELFATEKNDSSITCKKDFENIMHCCGIIAETGNLGDEPQHKFRNTRINEEEQFDDIAKKDIAKLLASRYGKVKNIIKQNKHIIRAIADELEASKYLSLDDLQINRIIKDNGGIVM